MYSINAASCRSCEGVDKLLSATCISSSGEMLPDKLCDAVASCVSSELELVESS